MSKRGSSKPGTFQPGNTVGLGNRGPAAKPKIITDAIVAKLHEVDRKTSRAHVFKLVDELFEQAYAKDYPVLDKNGKPKRDADGKPVVNRVLGDLSAKKEIIDRADGKAIQGHSMEQGSGKVTIVFEAADERLG